MGGWVLYRSVGVGHPVKKTIPEKDNNYGMRKNKSQQQPQILETGMKTHQQLHQVRKKSQPKHEGKKISKIEGAGVYFID